MLLFRKSLHDQPEALKRGHDVARSLEDKLARFADALAKRRLLQAPDGPTYRISGHETVSCRYTWLPKAVKCLRENLTLFSDEPNAMVALGVGKNMVRSIRFWSQPAKQWGLLDGENPAHWYPVL